MDKFTSTKDIMECLDSDGFEVHNIMFSNRDLIQALLYVSPFCWSVIQNKYNPTGVNSFMITVNQDDEVLMLTPGRTTRARDSMGPMNEILRHNETSAITFVVSTGFLLDTFEFSPPKLENDGKFIVESTGDLIMFRDDLEALMKVVC